LSALEDALKITKKLGTLTDAQRVTLNSSLPNNRGMINPDGTFTIIGLEGAPLKLDAAKVMMTRLLARSEEMTPAVNVYVKGSLLIYSIDCCFYHPLPANIQYVQ
jgi:hypothetical protein